MKIVSLKTENFKRIETAEIRPDGNLVQITGANGQGKSSVLDSIWALCGGKNACPTVPIRKGQVAGRVTGVLDNGLKLTRNFRLAEGGTDYTTSIQVEGADGAVYKSPQAMLDGFLGALSFDPLAFSRMDDKAQFDCLRQFVPDVDFEKIDGLNRGDFNTRTEVNRRAKEAQAAAGAIRGPDSPPGERIDESALVAQLRLAGEHNASLEQRRANRERVADQIADNLKSIERLRREAEALRRQADEKEGEAAQISERSAVLQEKLNAAEPLAAPMDTTALSERINAARDANRTLDEWTADRRRKGELEALAKQLTEEAGALTAAMETRNASKQAAIAAAKMPVAGLEFGEGRVLLNGVPFSQGSDAEQLRTSVAIAAALNPKLRVIRIRDGSLLDTKSMHWLAEFAEKTDMQIWIEIVDTSGEVGFVLEDGRLKNSEAAATAAA